mmetsp:Transcript_6285/g.14921  ORF Transcript_6285/g.14921 Transcript_6285/m.14921 type:complete len:505 (-) Transcript_6285:211-1725(-)
MEGIEGSLLPLHSELKLEDAISVLKFRQTLREESEEFPRPRSVDPASAAVASMPPEELSGLLEDSWRSAESRRPFTTPGASRPHGLSRSNTCNSSFSISGSDILRPKSIIIDEPIPSRLVNMLKQASDFERQSREKSSASRRSLFTQSCGSLRSKANLSSSRLGRARSLRQQTSRVLESRGRRPPGPRHGWPRTIGGGRLPEIKGCISDTEKQKVKELPKSSASTRPKKHSGPQDVSLEAACAFWNIATPAEERRAQQARRNTSKDSSKGAKYSGEDAVSRVLNAGPGAPELARAVGLPVQVAKEAASLFRRFGNIPSKGSLFQGKLQMSRLPEVLVALCDVTEISEISEAFVDWALKAADRDSSSSMDVQEFAIWYSSFCFAEEVTVKPEVRETRELARQMGLEIGQIEQFKVAFDRYDEDGSGEIEFEEFSNMVQELLKIPHGQELPHDRLMTMWRSADMQQKGCLDFREFCFFYFRMGATGQGSDPIADYYRNVRHVPVAP